MQEASTRRRTALRPRNLLSIAWLAAGLLAGLAQAQTPVSSEPTNLTSNDELMISFRHQERMWQTPDGALHLVINRGTLRPNPGLGLFTSYDGGTTWTAKASFARTNRNSTLDGELDGTTLSVVYGDSSDAVAFVQLSYDSTTQAWTVTRSESVFKSSDIDGMNPTLAFDDAGVAWCSFAASNTVGDQNSLRWFYRPTEGTWVDSGLVVGPTDNVQKARSGRPVRLRGAMGLIYRIGKKTYWTVRPNAASADFLADPQLIQTGSAQAKRSDPWASHFSVVADDGGYVHLAIADNGAAMYLRYSTVDGTWTTPRQINDQGSLSYLQMGLANGQLQLSLSASRGAGAVYLSNDYGDSFTQAFALKLPQPSAGVSYKTGRVETPARSSGPLPVLEQYEDNSMQELMVYKVPVP